jgi:hypothetical protein
MLSQKKSSPECASGVRLAVIGLEQQVLQTVQQWQQ